jgi:hypothetical protein
MHGRSKIKQVTRFLQNITALPMKSWILSSTMISNIAWVGAQTVEKKTTERTGIVVADHCSKSEIF